MATQGFPSNITKPITTDVATPNPGIISLGVASN